MSQADSQAALEAVFGDNWQGLQPRSEITKEFENLGEDAQGQVAQLVLSPVSQKTIRQLEIAVCLTVILKPESGLSTEACALHHLLLVSIRSHNLAPWRGGRSSLLQNGS